MDLHEHLKKVVSVAFREEQDNKDAQQLLEMAVSLFQKARCTYLSFVGTRLFYGTVAMGIPAGGNWVRQVEITLRPFSAPPAITATVQSPKSPGEAFVIYNITVVQDPAQTVIKLSATNVECRVPSDLPYLCSYVVVGLA